MFLKIFSFIKKHKIITIILALIIIGGIYFSYQKLYNNKNIIRYVTAAVEKGTLIVSVSGSGQVSASNQVDIKPKASGDVIYLGVKNGQEVKAGTFLAQIDASDAKRAVQDAEISLETARNQLEDLLELPDELTLLQAENSLAKAKQSKQEAEENIIEGYEDAYNAVADAFFDLPEIITGLNKILYSYEIADSVLTLSNYWNVSALVNSIDIDNRDELERFIKSAENDYKISVTKYDENLKNYKNTSRYSEHDIIEALLEETIDTVRTMTETIKSEINMLDFWVNYRSRKNLPVFSKVTGYQSDLRSYTSKTNSLLSSLLKIQRSFQDNRQAVLDTEYSIREKEISFSKLIAGSDELDIRSKKITIQQKEDALITARENLAGCYIYAPFDGVVAEVYIEKGDSVSSSTKLLTLASKQKLAEITLNEIDVAEIKVNQKATITFDAIEGLTITGEVVEIDTLGTVSQGVVTYNLKIAFDTQDDRVKPGMSLSVTIITDVKQNALLVPNSAVKYQGDILYVQVAGETTAGFNPATANISGVVIPVSDLHTQSVQIGLSNDTTTEIIDGLKEGDYVVIQTIAPNSTTNQSQQNTGSSLPGMPTGGGQMRMIR